MLNSTESYDVTLFNFCSRNKKFTFQRKILINISFFFTRLNEDSVKCLDEIDGGISFFDFIFQNHASPPPIINNEWSLTVM